MGNHHETPHLGVHIFSWLVLLSVPIIWTFPILVVRSGTEPNWALITDISSITIGYLPVFLGYLAIRKSARLIAENPNGMRGYLLLLFGVLAWLPQAISIYWSCHHLYASILAWRQIEEEMIILVLTWFMTIPFAIVGVVGIVVVMLYPSFRRNPSQSIQKSRQAAAYKTTR